MEKIVLDILAESIAVKDQSIRANVGQILAGADLLAECLAAGHKVMIFGNGGSAADSQHIAAEFVNRFRIERPPLAAIALSTDSSILTSIGNDYRFEDVFSKQIRALGKRDDVAWGLSTSGNSKNVIEAIDAARDLGMRTIGMSGRGGELARCAELVYCVESDVTARIQETHITLGHILCELVDRILYPNK